MYASYALVFFAGMMAGAMNAVAGGGSFVSFPALVLAGVPPVSANMSSTVALFPASFMSAFAYRKDFQDIEGISLKRLLPVSLAGGVTGALLLLFTPSTTFNVLVPWLLLLGLITFTFGREIGDQLRKYMQLGPRGLLALQYCVAIYGGYFGAAVGIMMLALWSLFGVHDLKATGAVRSILVGSLNAAAVILFVFIGDVTWSFALMTLAGGLVGGYVGARIARTISQAILRRIVITIISVITATYFWRVFG